MMKPSFFPQACQHLIVHYIIMGSDWQPLWKEPIWIDFCWNCDPFFFLRRNKFVEFDMKPVCKKCYEKFPLELKKRLKKLSDAVARK